MISEMAKRPISTGKISKPAFSSVSPKVKRGIASTGAMPTVEKANPMTPEKSPLTIEPLARVMINVSEKMAMEKYSCGPKLSATLASVGAMNISAKILSSVPT